MFDGPHQHLAEPGINIPESRLSGFQSNHPGNNGTIHLSADATDQFIPHLVHRSDQHITGGSTHYLAHVVGLNLCTQCTQVGIKSTGTHADRSRQSKLF